MARCCRTPSTCYPTLEGKKIEAEGAAFSWKGRVFRYESRNLVGLDRLWEFNVRELVFVGGEAHVADCRARVLPVIGELAQIFDLECRIETASDPFFRFSMRPSFPFSNGTAAMSRCCNMATERIGVVLAAL